MSHALPACVSATRRRPLEIVLREALLAASLGLGAAWVLAELALAVQGL